jgi:hypothetical protein
MGRFHGGRGSDDIAAPAACVGASARSRKNERCSERRRCGALLQKGCGMSARIRTDYKALDELIAAANKPVSDRMTDEETEIALRNRNLDRWPDKEGKPT